LFYALFTRLLGRWRGAAATAIAIALYTLLVGLGASVLRAAIMAWIGLLGAQIGRRQAGANSLTFTAAVMCLFTPSLPWNVSFQLTFMATLGLVLYATPLQTAFKNLAARFLPPGGVDKLAGPIGDYFLMTLAAQITTLPIMAYQFRSLSLIALIANPLILPPQPLVEILGGVALLGGLVDLSLGRWLGYLAWPFVAYTNRLVMALGAIPNSAISLGPVSLALVLLFYGILFGLTLSKDKASLVRRVLSPDVALVGLAAAVAVVWSLALTRPDGYLHLMMLPSGATETLLIQSPGGQTVLINGAAGPAQLNQALGRRQSIVNRNLDLLIIASAKKEDLAGLPHAVENFPPQWMLWAIQPDSSAASRQLTKDLSTQSITTSTAIPGQRLDLGRGAALEILSLGGKQGATFLLTWGAFRALLPTSWVASGTALTPDPGANWHEPVNVLLMPGSGAVSLNPPGWIASLHPQVILLSVPAQNRSSLPDAEALQAAQGFQILRTDQNGWIEITTDGRQMWVTEEKK